MIYDCFQFFNELDVIEIRFKELYDVVDYFVVSESPVTHSGLPKPLYFAENRARYAKYEDKIKYVLAVNQVQTLHPDVNWNRENFQRNQIAEALRDCNNDDIIIISDADEIVRASKIAEIKSISAYSYYSLEMVPSYYHLNLQSYSKWTHAKALTYKYFKGHFSNLSEVRNGVAPHTIHDCGWHFSYMGGVDKLKEKILSFAHQELNTPGVTEENRLRTAMRSSVSFWHVPGYPAYDEHKKGTFNTNLPKAEYNPFWRYYKPTDTNLPKCYVDFPHLVSNVFFENYPFTEFEALYHIGLEYNGYEGDVVVVNASEGYVASYLANSLSNSMVHCVGAKEGFKTNMAALTDGNYTEYSKDAIELLESFNGKIKLLFVEGVDQYNYLKPIMDLYKDKMAPKSIVCGYDFCNEETRRALFDSWETLYVTGRFWRIA